MAKQHDKSDDLRDYYTPKRFAAKHGVHPNTVYRHIKKGNLPGTKKFGGLRIPKDAELPEPDNE